MLVVAWRALRMIVDGDEELQRRVKAFVPVSSDQFTAGHPFFMFAEFTKTMDHCPIMAVIGEGDGVYPPDGDSFLLADALAGELSRLPGAARGGRGGRARAVLEVGCGSGYVGASAALLLAGARGAPGADVFGSQ